MSLVCNSGFVLPFSHPGGLKYFILASLQRHFTHAAPFIPHPELDGEYSHPNGLHYGSIRHSSATFATFGWSLSPSLYGDFNVVTLGLVFTIIT